MDGIIVVNKPQNFTSFDVVAVMRRLCGQRKIGHTGTLDPMATGVLPLLLGNATRAQDILPDSDKEYVAQFKLGVRSDTLDIWGNIISDKKVKIVTAGDALRSCVSDTDGPVTVSEADIRKAFSDYTGSISQIPPKYSALRINGKRAYELAREGKDFEIKPRIVTISRNEITDIDAVSGLIEFDAECSKGTYIRTICDDIGRTLGCGAAMTSLVRTRSGYFDINESLDLSELVEMSDAEIEERIIPMEMTLTELGIAELDDNRFSAFINGNSSAVGYRVLKKAGKTDFYRVYCCGEFLGTAYFKGKELCAAKVIYGK